MQVPATRIVPCALEGFVDGVVRLCEIDGDAEGALDVVLREVADEVIRREGIGVEGGDVVVVTAGGFDIGTFDLVLAVGGGVVAGFVDGGVGAGE